MARFPALSVPRAFGKTALAEQIQAWVGEAVADAWDQGYAQGSEDEHTGIVTPNPHRQEH